MTDLERLTALLDNAPADPAGNRNVRTLAEYLLANGVIVPPCKVGDTVYVISQSRVKETKIDEIYRYRYGTRIFVEFDCDEDCEGCPFEAWAQSFCGEWDCASAYGSAELAEDDFGKTVFLTREEAERELNGGVRR